MDIRGNKVLSGAAEKGRRTRGGRLGAVYETLHRQILTLELAPGEPLDETQLAKRFGMSRSPVREALNRLCAQGLVVMLTNRSTLVAPLDIATFPRYIEALDLSHRINTRLAAQNRTTSDVSKLRKMADAFDDTLEVYDHLEMSQANKAFHMTVAEVGRNPYLARHYDVLLDEERRLLHLNFDHFSQIEKAQPQASEHHEMVDAIEAGDVELADKLAHNHTHHFHERFLNSLRTKYAQGFDIGPSFISRNGGQK